MTIRGKAHIVGAYEHPARRLPDSTVPHVHAEVVTGALADAGLTLADVDGFFTDGTVGFGPISMAEYLGLHVEAMRTPPRSADRRTSRTSATPRRRSRQGKCSIALVSLAGIASALTGAARAAAAARSRRGRSRTTGA